MKVWMKGGKRDSGRHELNEGEKGRIVEGE